MISQKIYFAPLEGITNYIFRNAYHRCFGSGVIDRYFAPFLAPRPNLGLTAQERRDIVPENNNTLPLIPQILTDRSVEFLKYAALLKDYGYEEINLNVGCPSATVTSKGRGAAFLGRLPELEQFLDEIFDKTPVKLSVKTRLGVTSVEEFGPLLELYNRYPMTELIVHCRVMKEMYKGEVHWDMFTYAAEHSKNQLVYNGDIRKPEDVTRIIPSCERIMIGRGAVADPLLPQKILQGSEGALLPGADSGVFLSFVEELGEEYQKILSGDAHLLAKMKEIWSWLHHAFPGTDKLFKKLMKTRTYADFYAMEKEIICQK